MFPAEEEPVEVSAPRRINWKLILAILAVVILLALLTCAAYYAAKSGAFAKGPETNITKNITKPEGTVVGNITEHVVANATKTFAAMNFSKLANAFGNAANWTGTFIGRPVVKYSLIGIIAAAALICAIILLRNVIMKHWKMLLLILAGAIVIAASWYLVRRYWTQIVGALVGVKDFFASYWLYIISGIVVLGVIIAVILAVRSEDNDEQVAEVKPAGKKKSSKRKK
jgi:hypothetical protein